MSKNLIAVYKMEVFDDGTVKQTLLEQYAVSSRADTVQPEEVSARIRQIVGVVKEWVRLKNSDTGTVLNSNDLANHAIRLISEQEEVSYSTVADKATRQLYGSMKEFVSALDKFHDSQGNDRISLESKLKAVASSRTTTEDRQYISQAFNNIIEKYYINN